MRILALMILGLMVVGCGKDKETPVKELTKEDVVGSYEASEEDGDTFKLVLLGNGRFEIHFAGKKKGEGAWKFEAKEVHALEDGKEVTSVFKIESNGDLTEIANIGEERTELPFRIERAFKKIK